MRQFNTPLVLKGKTLRNPFILAPMTTYSSNPDLTISNQELAYYKTRALEFGMIISAATAVSKHAQAFENQITAMSDDYLDSLKKLSKTIKKEGALAILQLHHGGRMSVPNLFENQEVVAPSAVKADRAFAITPRALKTEEVYETIDDFVDAAKRALIAGFDGIEIHGANTYLIQQFFSPQTNQRDDEFGGSRTNRLNFPIKILDKIMDAVKQSSNPDFIVGYRLSPEETETPGITLEDTKILVQSLIDHDIDYIHLSQSSYRNSSLRDPEDKTPIIHHLKKDNSKRVPFIGAGHVYTAKEASDAFGLGYDLVALGSIALSDPHAVKNLQKGKDPSTTFSKDSMIPDNLFSRLEKWSRYDNEPFKFSKQKNTF
jgi:2,4-dienoyl-CoA reductase-like NADH-dependent reductase (Old Yellow Enzyme family)